MLRAHPGNASDRFLRWVVRDGAQREAMLVGVRGAETHRVFLAGAGMELDTTKSSGRTNVFTTQHLKVASQKSTGVTRCRVVSVQARSPMSLVQAFDQAVRHRDGEDTIERLLRAVDGRVRKIRVRAPVGEEPLIEVDMGLSERIPLAQVGQGMSRLVAMFSEILGEKPEVCLIDEIENGIHHSMLRQIWQGIAVAAAQLDVQVFATTHSHECILAAHEAFAATSDYDFGIVQLFRIEKEGDSGVQGRVLDQKLIEAAIAGEIDLR